MFFQYFHHTDKFSYPSEDLYPLQNEVPLIRLYENLSLRACLNSNSLSLVCGKSLYPETADESSAPKPLREMWFEKQWSDEAFCAVLGD